MLVFVGRLCPEFVRAFNQVMVLLVDVRKSSVGNCPSITVWSSQVCVFSEVFYSNRFSAFESYYDSIQATFWVFHFHRSVTAANAVGCGT